MARAQDLAGEYQMNRKSVTTDEKLAALLAGGIINLTVDKDGYLLVTSGGVTTPFAELAPGVYQNIGEGPSRDAFGKFHRIIFQTDPLGRTMLTTDGPMTYSQAPFYATLNFTAVAALGIILIILGSLIYWLVRMLAGLFIKRENKKPIAAVIAAWVGILTSINVVVLIANLFSAPPDPVYQLPPDAYLPAAANPLLEVMPVLMWTLTGLLVLFTVIAWRKGFWGIMARLHYSLFTVAAIGLMGMLYYWNIFI